MSLRDELKIVFEHEAHDGRGSRKVRVVYDTRVDLASITFSIGHFEAEYRINNLPEAWGGRELFVVNLSTGSQWLDIRINTSRLVEDLETRGVLKAMEKFSRMAA